MATELWKPIPDTYGGYYISSHGRVYSTKRNIFLKQRLDGRGYLQFDYYSKGKKITIKTHRVVAKVFIHQPSKEQNTVNHIDGNKLNNHIHNLEWLTLIDNVEHSFRNGLHNTPRKAVVCIDTGVIYKSTHDASKHTGVSQGNISNACLGKNKTAGGYTWKYIDKGEN